MRVGVELLKPRAGIIAVVLLAAALRIYDLSGVPAGLYCDEAGLGYNAFALATAGIDENGERWPLYVWSFGTSYKNPLFIYSAVVPVAVFGLNEFSVRLTAALFGIGTVIAIYFLGRVLYGPRAGLWAALFLAVCPWHLHFSRIAFELISFPFLFVLGFLQLARFTKGGRTLPAAALFFALCIYTYAVAALFVPLFVLGFAVLLAPELRRHWRQAILATAVGVAALAPAVVFFTRKPSSGTQYFRYTTYLDPSGGWLEQIGRFASNYRRFFSSSFLLWEGDPIPRHAVQGFGELLTLFVPFVLIGIGFSLVRPRRNRLLVLWWLLLYPVGASLMTEIPSATRSIIGAPVFCLLAGFGIAEVLEALGRVGGGRARVLVPRLAAAAALVALGVQAGRYLRAYFVDYPKYSAGGVAGFQYGYRDVIEYMESQRSHYERLLITRTESNQPQIFPAFYERIDPKEWSRRRMTGFDFVYPELEGSYSIRPSALFAVLPSELGLFREYDVKKRVLLPGGETAFVIIEPKSLKKFLRGWLALGLFPNDDWGGLGHDFIDVDDVRHTPYAGAFGPAYWKVIRQNNVRVDLNRYYASADPRTPGNPEWVCAYAVTALRTPDARQAYLEISGSWGDSVEAWLDGRSITPWPLFFEEATLRRPIELGAGSNFLLLKSCESISWWYFDARVTDAAGEDLNRLQSEARLPPPEWRPRPPAPVTDLHVVEGFAAIVDSQQPEEAYPDYRGEVTSWRAAVDHATHVAWRTAPVREVGPAIFAFTASTSDEVADFALFVDGRPALTFQSGPRPGVRHWERDGYRLTFASKKSVAGNSGIYLLAVPPESLTPGRAVELRVQPGRGDPLGWFMIKSYGDTIAHEGITPRRAKDAVFSPWEEVRAEGER